jgi:hypothetical protein
MIAPNSNYTMKGNHAVQENDMPLDWRRSEYCGNAACVEVAVSNGTYFVRDSKRPETSPLTFDHAEWEAFVAGVRAGNFDFN